MEIDELFGGFDGSTGAAAPTTSASDVVEESPKVQPARKKRKKAAFAIKVTETKKVVSESGRGMTSFSVLPVDYVEEEEREAKAPAKTYAFELDPFQKAANQYIENDESVLVAAHTSAGKTVVAEYAIAKSLRDNQRVIYTSPIKALSNQKFRDLQAEFGDVGLLTGDVSINPAAKCVVMTTEILRSMLYRGSELCREVKWVVFDEIHYMRDKDRGVVWEESIVLLPHSVRLVFLSATIPNAAQFASWIATIHRQPCHVVYTEFRPTPLVHYAFAKDGLHLVVDEKASFKRANFDKAVAKLSGGGGEKPDAALKSILAHVQAAELQPCIVFAFSKVKCEKNLQALKEAEYNTADEASLVRQIYAAAVTSLSEEDRKLPQVSSLVSILERGVGIHHGGLLPLVKEVVEILFQEGLIKVLFATETFAIGINMPAKSVVFTELRKFDGSEFRLLSPSEYIQMSGRAGRRGKDDRGTVVLCLESDDDPEAIRDMLQGNAEPLDSSYHLTYNMLLNLLRVEGADPEYLVRSSFRQFQRETTAPSLDLEADEIEGRALRVEVDPAVEAAATKLAAIDDQIALKRKEIAETFYTPSVVAPWLQPGRLVDVDGFGWVAVLSSSASATTVLSGEDAVRIEPSAIRRFSAVRVFAPPDPRKPDARKATAKAVAEVFKRFPDDKSLPLLDDAADLGVAESEKLETFKAQLRALEEAAPRRDEVPGAAVAAVRERLALEKLASSARARAKEARTMVLRDELRRMRRVLRRLDHVSADGVIALKGRAACELNTADELVAAQLLLGGAFQDLEPPEIASLLSCLVFAEKQQDSATSKPPPLRPRLAQARKLLLEAAKTVYDAMRDSNVDVDERDYLDSFNPDMMPLVFEWANGANFLDLTKLTDAYEGTVVRVIRRLDELLRQLASAAHAIGNFDLKATFDQASAAIKRDIVFAASLYL